MEIQNQLASINLELESMKGNNEQLSHEKWELSQVNTDLQQRLQQTVALARMQVSCKMIKHFFIFIPLCVVEYVPKLKLKSDKKQETHLHTDNCVT